MTDTDIVLLAAERTRAKLEQIASGVPVDGFVIDPGDVSATVVAMNAFSTFIEELRVLQILNYPR